MFLDYLLKNLYSPIVLDAKFISLEYNALTKIVVTNWISKNESKSATVLFEASMLATNLHA